MRSTRSAFCFVGPAGNDTQAKGLHNNISGFAVEGYPAQHHTVVDRTIGVFPLSPLKMCDVVKEKKPHIGGLWAARSRQRCVGVIQAEAEVDQLATGTPVVPERAQAEVLSTENLDKYLDANSRYGCVVDG